MSVTGPQTRLWQRAGVAKSRTTGFLPTTFAKSSECMSSGGTRVSIWEMFETWPAVRVWTTGACWPTCGIG